MRHILEYGCKEMRPSAWIHNSQAPGHPEGQNFAVVSNICGYSRFKVFVAHLVPVILK